VCLGVNSAAAAKECPNLVAGRPECVQWVSVVVFGPTAMVRRYLRGPSAGGRRIDRAGKTLPTALRRGKLDLRIEFMLPDGVHLGKIGERAAPLSTRHSPPCRQAPGRPLRQERAQAKLQETQAQARTDYSTKAHRPPQI
jgi:hypothetical protein